MVLLYRTLEVLNFENQLKYEMTVNLRECKGRQFK